MEEFVQRHIGNLVRATSIALFGWGLVLMSLTFLQVAFSQETLEYQAYGVSALLVLAGLAGTIAGQFRSR